MLPLPVKVEGVFLMTPSGTEVGIGNGLPLHECLTSSSTSIVGESPGQAKS